MLRQPLQVAHLMHSLLTKSSLPLSCTDPVPALGACLRQMCYASNARFGYQNCSCKIKHQVATGCAC